MSRTLPCLLVAVLFLNPPPAKPQDIFTLAAIPLAARSIKDILSDFQTIATRLLQQGQNIANGALSHAGDEMQITVQNMGIILGQQEKKLFSDLDANEVAVFSHLNDLIASVNNASSSVITTEQLTFIDLQNLLNQIPFISKAYFYVSSARGLVMTSTTTLHPVTLLGLGFGQDQSNTKYAVTISIDGKILDPTAWTRKSLGELDIEIPDLLLSQLFDDTRPKHVPIYLTSVISHYHKGLLGGKWSADAPISVSFDLMLLPKQAGNLKFIYPLSTSKKSDGKQIPAPPLTMETSSCSPDSPCQLTNYGKLDLNQRYIESTLTYHCSGDSDACSQCFSQHLTQRLQCNANALAPCQLEYPVQGACKLVPLPPDKCRIQAAGPRVPQPCQALLCPRPDLDAPNKVSACIGQRCANLESAPDYILSNQNQRIDVFRSCKGSGKALVEYDISFENLVDDVTTTSVDVPLKWGQDAIIEIPSVIFSASGRLLFTNQEVTFDQVSGSDNTLVKLVSIADTGRGTYRITLRPVLPLTN